MVRWLLALYRLLFSSTGEELIRTVEYLKAENRILRDKLPERVEVTPQERVMLVRLGFVLSDAIRKLVKIVPRSFSEWVKAEEQLPRKAKGKLG